MVGPELKPTDPVLSALVVPDAAQITVAKTNIVPAIAKLLCLRMGTSLRFAQCIELWQVIL
jgi:hypothetical protein